MGFVNGALREIPSEFAPWSTAEEPCLTRDKLAMTAQEARAVATFERSRAADSEAPPLDACFPSMAQIIALRKGARQSARPTHLRALSHAALSWPEARLGSMKDACLREP